MKNYRRKPEPPTNYQEESIGEKIMVCFPLLFGAVMIPIVLVMSLSSALRWDLTHRTFSGEVIAKERVGGGRHSEILYLIVESPDGEVEQVRASVATFAVTQVGDERTYRIPR